MSLHEEPNDSQEGRQLQPLDPVAAVRQHPNWFFSTGRFERGTAIGLLVSEILQSPLVRDTHVRQVDGWVAVSADADWLDGDLEAFTKPTLYPEGGTNATRVEVLFTAFCDAVLTASNGQRSDIRTVGENSMPPSMVEALADQELGRVIVFLVPPTENVEVPTTVSRNTDRMAHALAGFPERKRQFQNA